MSVKTRIACVSYLNARPLVWDLARRETEGKISLSFMIPSRVAEALHEGEADLALIPSAEYREDYRVLPGASIAAHGKAGSVFLIGSVSPQKMKRVALDPASRTSTALVRILFAERWKASPEFIDADPLSTLREKTCDGALVIGDPALGLKKEEWPYLFDVGKTWADWTGLPFVFAFWAGREGLEDLPLFLLRESRKEGLEHLSEIASHYAETHARDAAFYERYLRDCLSFGLGPRELEGLNAFYRLAEKHGLIPKAPVVRFF